MVYDKTLLIKNLKLEKSYCYALSPKIYVNKLGWGGNSKASLIIRYDNELFVNVFSMVIDDIYQFVKPILYNDGRIDCNTMLEELKLNHALRIDAPLSISSLYGEAIIATIWTGFNWYELICKKVELQNSNLDAFVIVYLKNDEHLYKDINTLTMNSIQLKKLPHTISEEDGWDCILQIPIALAYSIEPLCAFTTSKQKYIKFNECNWEPNEIVFSQIHLKINYDEKTINGYYLEDKELKGGRRTSNGWENKFLHQEAYFYKAFKLRYNLLNYIRNLEKILEPIKGKIDGDEGKIANNDRIEASIKIEFKEPLKFVVINKILQFNVEGSEYIFYD